MAKGKDFSAMFRNAGAQAKQNLERRQHEESGEVELTEDGRPKPFKPKIFTILEYIESAWGLNMKLYPAQQAIVKLYYNLPLEEKEKTIAVKDMLGEKIRYNFTEKEYVEFLYNEGRCNIKEPDHPRNELIMAIGRRGGKCCRENTYVNTHVGLRKIETLGDSDGPEYQPLEITVAQEGGKRAVSAYFYNGGERDTISVTTHCRYQEEGTPNHRLKVMGDDGNIQWKRLDEIEVGDYLCVNRTTDMWPKEEVELTLPAVPLSGKRVWSLPSKLNEEWGCFLGVLVGDGTWGAKGCEVTVGPYPEWLSQVRYMFSSLLGSYTEVPAGKRASRVRFFSRRLREFLDLLGYSSSCDRYTKSTPWSIMQSPKPVVAAYLRGLFETDGGVEDERRITFCTASSELARETQLLLLNFGIISRVKEKWNKKYQRHYYILSLLGTRSVRTFHREIGFLSARKQSLLQSYIDKGNQGNKSNTESIPRQREWCRRLLESVPKNNGNPVCRKLGWRRTFLRQALGNVIKPSSKEELTYPRLKEVVDVARDVGADHNIIQHFEEILTADYFFDSVVSVEQGRGKVYDLNVPDGASFAANGFTNHNTTLSGIFASYEIYRLLNLNNPQKYYGFTEGSRITLTSIATDKEQAGLLFNEVTTHLANCHYFKPYIASNTQGHVLFRTPSDLEKHGPVSRHQDGKFVSLNGKASLRITFKSCVAKGLRGHSNAVVILDEVAHFQNQGQASAQEIYNAVTPSTATYSPKDPDDKMIPIGPVESRTILISSPLNRTGLFYNQFHLAMSKGPGSENLLAVQAPTWEINPTVPSSYYKQKYHADPAVFMTEHGAQFSDRVRGWIEREDDLVACIDPNHKPVPAGVPRQPHEMGIDVGLSQDGTAISITTSVAGKVVLVYHEYWQAGVDWRESNPHLKHPPTDYCKVLKDQVRLDFDEIANWIEALTKKFFIVEGIFDRWTGVPLEQALHKKGLTQFRTEYFPKDLSSKIYQNAKMLMFDEALVLYDYPLPEPGEQGGSKHSAFINELLQLQAEQVSKNLVVVQAPQTAGFHDDRADSYVRAVWLTASRMHNEKIVYGGSGNRPITTSNRMTPEQYQKIRARRHGHTTDRPTRGRRRGKFR